MITARRARRLLGHPALGMAAGTTLSRATGLARTLVLASALGVTSLGDAYNVANTAPNIVFQLVIGGLLGSSLVPLLVQAGGEDERRRTAATLLTVVTIASVGVGMALLVSAPVVVRLLALGARSTGDYTALLDLATRWLRMFAPQVPFYALSVVAVAVMTARGRLALGGFAPIATNVITIVGAVVFAALATGATTDVRAVSDGQVAALGWATTGGVAAMALIQLWGAIRAEPGMTVSFAPRDPVVARLVRLAGWVILYVAVNQVGLAVSTALTATVEGGVSAYQWAFVITQLPFGIVAVSLYSAAFPYLSAAANAGGDVTPVVARAAGTASFVMVPAAVGLIVLAGPVSVAVVGLNGAGLVEAGVIGFAVALPAFSLFQLLTRTSYAFQDTRSPALVNVALNAVHVASSVAAVLAFRTPAARILSLALANAAAYVAGCLLLGRKLVVRRRITIRALVAGLGARTLAATAGMAAAVSLALRWLPGPTSQLEAAVLTLALAAMGSAVYLGLSAALRSPELARLAAPDASP